MLRPLLIRFISRLGGVVLKLLGATLRWHVTDAAGFSTSELKHPVLAAIWHNRILILPLCFEWICRRRRRVTVLTSPSRDGLLLANFVGYFGMSSVHGSSSRRGSIALRQLQAAIKSGSDVAITPDGPRGPVYQLNPGLLYLAAKMDIPIMAIQVDYEACWTLRSWDKFQIPKPFSTVHIRFMKPVSKADFDDASVEKYHQAIIDSLGATDVPIPV
ncbi:MAG: lysophospholipid acyltransferase family protein [Verrucomicrobiota bacterium]